MKNAINTKEDGGDSLSTDNKSSLAFAAIVKFWGSFNLCRADFGHINLYEQFKGETLGVGQLKIE